FLASCLGCSASSPELRCSRCDAPYCSPQCQRSHWKEHRAVCSINNSNSNNSSSSNTSSNNNHNSNNNNCNISNNNCSQQLAGVACAVTPLSSSGQVERSSSSCCPRDLRLELRPFSCRGWREYLAERKVEQRDAAERLKGRECFALAALEALSRLPKSESFRLQPVSGRCVLWVLGARDGIEKRQIVEGAWEPLFEILDVGWDVVLIGPEMEEDRSVLSAPGRRLWTFSCLAHEAVMPESLQRPTFVLVFNSGLGASVVVHMQPWVQTLARLLLMKTPVLWTCFGPHEAQVEVSVLRALHAQYSPHAEGGFSYVLEPDKPLSVCNAMFTWVSGSQLSDEQLLSSALPHVEAQLAAAKLVHFLKEVRSHLKILSDPEGAAHSGWAEMYDGRFMPSLKRALEEDDDDRCGIQTIVRCSLKTLASAAESPTAASLVAALGGEAVLQSFEAWAQRGHWTSHDWVRKEVLTRVAETRQLLQAAKDPSGVPPSVAPFSASLKVRAAKGAQLRRDPSASSPVVATVGQGRSLSAQAQQELWLRVRTSAGDEGWLLAFQDNEHVCDMLVWDIKACDPP
ncbi:unnamed protein product, partial [Polarella glacialis]